MSWDTMSWAKAQRTGSVGAKAVLMALAEYADEVHSCYPSQETIGHDTEQSVSTVYRHIKALIKAGIITKEHRAGIGDGRSTDRYVLLVATGQIDGGSIGQNGGGNRSLLTDKHQEHQEEQHTSPSGNVQTELPTVAAIRERRSSYPDEFDLAWLAYPKNKGAKMDAYNSWRASVVIADRQGVKRERRIEALITAARNYALDCETNNRSIEHVMHGATFWGPRERWRPWFRSVTKERSHVPSWATGQKAAGA